MLTNITRSKQAASVISVYKQHQNANQDSTDQAQLSSQDAYRGHLLCMGLSPPCNSDLDTLTVPRWLTILSTGPPRMYPLALPIWRPDPEPPASGFPSHRISTRLCPVETRGQGWQQSYDTSRSAAALCPILPPPITFLLLLRQTG